MLSLDVHGILHDRTMFLFGLPRKAHIAEWVRLPFLRHCQKKNQIRVGFRDFISDSHNQMDDHTNYTSV